jgi:hypothetical protein
MQRLRALSKTLASVVAGAAWVFVLGSLFAVAWSIASLLGNPSDPVAIIRTGTASGVFESWGLRYAGSFGIAAAAAQGLVVAAAAVASALPGPRFRVPRRVGHGVLCGWAALWAMNFVRITSLDHLLLMRAFAALSCALAACTLYRAVAGWRAGSPGRVAEPGVSA